MGRIYQNKIPSPPGQGYLAPPEHVRREFARRLADAMNAKGLNQSELARAATAHLPKGTKKAITRDLVSNYYRAQHVPRPLYLEALAAALDLTPGDLLPIGAVPTADRDTAPPIQTKEVEDGQMWLRLNVVLPWKMALKIVEMVKTETDKQSPDGSKTKGKTRRK